MGASLAALAKTEGLALMQAFDGRYNDSDGVSLMLVEQPNNYYYNISVKNNASVADQIFKWFTEAKAKSPSVSTSISNGKEDIILNCSEHVNIGLTIDKKKAGSIELWVHSPNPLK